MSSYYKNTLWIFTLLILFTSCKSTKTKASLYKNEAFACYYHDKFNGRKTANGEIFNNKKLTAAHKSLPFGTKIKITNLNNNKNTIVVINDRGPFTKGLDIDLSRKAFMSITDDPKKGKIKVSLEIIN